MLIYPTNYNASKIEFTDMISKLKRDQYHVFHQQTPIYDNLSIDKITIKTKKETMNRIVLTIGLHGIEGFVGHSCMMKFMDTYLSRLNDHTEIVLYHVLNPYGMKHFSRTNEHNVDLNRNFMKDKKIKPNPNYEIIRNFFTPKLIKNRYTFNTSFYTSLLNQIRKHSVKVLNDAILFGQSTDNKGVYFKGRSLQKSTTYIISEMDKLYSGVNQCVWLDIHTGYGPKFQMSIINSQYEKEATEELIEKLEYPLIWGTQSEDIYDVDGDIIEYIYMNHKKSKSKSKLLALCYEFGTKGISLKSQIESLKAIAFDNHIRYKNPSDKIKTYVRDLMKEQFLPQSEEWRIKAEQDFLQATTKILHFKNLI